MKTKAKKIDCVIPPMQNNVGVPFHLMLFVSLKTLILKNPNPPSEIDIKESLRKLESTNTPKWLDWVELIKHVSYCQNVVVGQHRLMWTNVHDLKVVEVNKSGLSQDELERFF